MKKILLSFYIITSITSCRTPEMLLRDNNIEPLIEKSSKVNTGTLRQILEKKTLGIHDMFVLAMDRSEKIAISSEDVYQAREKIREAWGAVLPQVSFRVGLYVPETISSSGASIFTRGFRFYARQNVLNGMDEITGFQAAPLYEKYTEEQLRAQASALYLQISQAYIQYLLMEDSLSTQKILLENTKDLKSELEKRFNLGKVRRSEILSVDVMMAKTEAAIYDLQNQLNTARKEIKNLTGYDHDFIAEDPDLENHIEIERYKSDLTYLERRPDLLSLKAAWELTRIETARILGGHMPKIYLEGSYSIPTGTGSPATDFYGALVAEVPLFSGGKTHSQYLSARSRERQARLRYDEASRMARQDLENSILNYETGARILDMQRNAREKAQKNYETIRADYRIGQATNLEVLSALNDSASVALDYEKTRLAQKLSIIQIRILTGELP